MIEHQNPGRTYCDYCEDRWNWGVVEPRSLDPHQRRLLLNGHSLLRSEASYVPLPDSQKSGGQSSIASMSVDSILGSRIVHYILLVRC